MVLINSLKEGYALAVHYISLLGFITVIYLTKNRNKPLTYFSIAGIGHTCSEVFRIMFFGFSMKDSPKWSCYVYTYTNFLTLGMESYIVMCFVMHLWLVITKKLILLGHREILTIICGFVIPFILSLFSVFPQFINGDSFAFPNAENCVTGYRQNAWQILLSGPGTVLPPFILSILFSAHIAYCFFTEPRQKITRNIEIFSTISYDSWARMLLFGILFGFLLVISIFSDIKNSINMIKYNTPEPGINSIDIIYFINAGMGIIVLFIFGTSSEAKKEISNFNTLPLHVSSNPELSYKFSNKSNKSRNPDLSYKYSNKSKSSKNSNPELSYKYSSKSHLSILDMKNSLKNVVFNSKDKHIHNNNTETLTRKNRFLDSFVETNNGSDSIIYGYNMLQLQELQKDSIDTINTADADILNEKDTNIKTNRKSEASSLELKYFSLNENEENYKKVLQRLTQQLQGLQNGSESTTDTDVINEKEPEFNRKSAISPLKLKYYSLNENADTYNKVLHKLQQQLHGLQNDNIISTSADVLNEKEENIGSNSRSEINLYSISEIGISGSKITTNTDILTEKEYNIGSNSRSEINLYSISESGFTGSKVTTNTDILAEKESNIGSNARSELNLYSISESGYTGSKVTTNTDILTEKESNIGSNTRSELNLYSISESGYTGSKVTTNTDILTEKESNIGSNIGFNTRSELNLYSISESGYTGSKVTTNTDILTEKESNIGFNEQVIQRNNNINIRNESTPIEINLYSISGSGTGTGSGVSSNKISDSESHENGQEIQKRNNNINIRNESTPIEINLYSISGSGSGDSSNKISDSENHEGNNIENEQEVQNNNHIENESSVQRNHNSENVYEVQIDIDRGNEQEGEVNVNNEEKLPRNTNDMEEIIIKSSSDDDHNDEEDNIRENDYEIPKSEINMKSKKEIIEEMILKLQETIVDMKDQKNIK